MFVYVPLILTALSLVLILSGLRVSGTIDISQYSEQIQQQTGQQISNRREVAIQPFSSAAMQHLASMSPPAREHVLRKAYIGLSLPLLVALWTVVFTYPLMTLYNERKDRSILFWKSMPVSDFTTIMVKLACVTLVVPAIYFACVVFVHLSGLLVASISAQRASVPVWDTLWAPSHLMSLWFNGAGYLLMNSIWFLPMYAWLFLVSAWARTVPLAWAAVVPFGLVVLERLFTPFHWVSAWISHYSWPLGLWQKQILSVSGSLPLMLNLQMLVSLAIAALMLYGAITMRGRTDEI